jgi:hypothetical protein
VTRVYDENLHDYRSSRAITPRFAYLKKRVRPGTKYAPRRFEDGNSTSNESCSGEQKSSKIPKAKLCKKPENLMTGGETSGLSSEGGLDVGGNYYSRLNSVVDKLQDHDW